MTKEKVLTQLDLAEQQLLGFSHACSGYSLISLIESMGLKEEEWKVLKRKIRAGIPQGCREKRD